MPSRGGSKVFGSRMLDSEVLRSMGRSGDRFESIRKSGEICLDSGRIVESFERLFIFASPEAMIGDWEGYSVTSK